MEGVAPLALERAMSQLRDENPDDAEVINRLIALLKTKEPKMVEIKAAISEFYCIPLNELTGRCRQYETALARQIFCYLSHHLTTRFSLIKIGSKVGLSDHTTVLHAIRKIEREVITKPRVRDEIDLLKMRISEKMLLRSNGRA